MKIMLGYIHTQSCYFLSSHIDAIPTYYIPLYDDEESHRNTIIHFIDSSVYKLGDYSAYYHIAIKYSNDELVQERLMRKLGNQYMSLIESIIKNAENPIVDEQLCDIAAKHYKLDIDNYQQYPHLAPYMTHDANNYESGDYSHITDRSARWFLDKGVPFPIISGRLKYVSKELLEETMDFLVNNPSDTYHGLNGFIYSCVNRECDFEGRMSLYQYI